MTDRLKGKRALITAAGQGIGRASALAMAREGASVLATDVNAAALESLAAEGVETRLLNVRDPASIAEAVEAAGPVDVLFNCAGFVANGTILDCDEEQWAFSLDRSGRGWIMSRRATASILPKPISAISARPSWATG